MGVGPTYEEYGFGDAQPSPDALIGLVLNHTLW